MSTQRGWYHFSHFEDSEIAYHDDDELPASGNGANPYGPFRTFGDAKRDAIEYHRATKRTADCCIAELKDLKKPRSPEDTTVPELAVVGGCE